MINLTEIKYCGVIFFHIFVAGLLGCNFVGIMIQWFVALQNKMIHYFAIGSWGHKFVGKGNPPKSTNIDPH